MSNLQISDQQLPRENRQEHKLSWITMFWLFIAGSLLGFVMEGVWHYLRTGTWCIRVATLWGPFCIIYGVGAVAMYCMAIAVKERPKAVQFLAFSLAGSGVEYIASVFQEIVFGTVSWDYSHHPLNLNGRISLRMTLLWGVLGMCAMYLLLPLMMHAFNRMHLTNRITLCRCAALFMTLNLLCTSVALLRWQERVHTASPASNAVEAWLDHAWPNTRMQDRFPNMQFVRDSNDLQ